MQRSIITDADAFHELCDHIRRCGLVAFDSEFVSDIGYRPALGLLQFATVERCVAVDPLEVTDLTEWWDIMSDDSTTVVVHGGQAEIRYCIQLGGQRPRKLVDIQIAEGFRGRSYPLSYGTIVERVLGRTVAGDQTRTDWLRRPLSPEQLEYALDDVSHVLPLWARQQQALRSRGRLEWALAECDRMCESILADEQTPAWERVSGIHRLPRREFAIARALAEWRETEAAARNRPPRRLIRDDLLLDLARRKPKTLSQALAVRDLNRPEYKRRLDDMLTVISRVLALPENQLPPRIRQIDDSDADDQILSRLLALALGNICAEQDLAQSLVGTNRDLLDLIRAVRTGSLNPPPLLLAGWRGALCGDFLKRVLQGRVRFRVAPANSTAPLVFEDDGDDVRQEP
jgi:ribonuclease D